MGQSAPAVPLPAVVPAVVPAAVPEIKKEIKESKSDKREGRRRSRSKSRERKDRSRERDRKEKRHRDRSRSRSRDRKERRRRDRSRSRGRSRSRDRDRRSSRDHHKRSEERTVPAFQRDPRKPMPEVWVTPTQTKNSVDVIPSPPQAPSLMGAFPVPMFQPKRALNSLSGGIQANIFPANNASNFTNNNGNKNNRDSWPPASNPNNNNNAFQNNRSSDNFLNKRSNMGPDNQDNFQNRFQRNNFQRNDGPRNNNNNRVEDNFSDCCIALEPFYGGYGDIRRFFQGLFISNKGIKFINDGNGHRTGIIYIQFGNRKSKAEALSRNGQNLNGINVSVSHVDDRDFNDAIDRFVPVGGNQEENNSSDGNFKHRTKNVPKNVTKYFNNSVEPEIKDFTCLIVDDLPTYCKEQDILHIFSQHPLVALILTTKPRGGNIAYVKFSSKEVAKNAYEEKNHHVIGGKQVTVKPCKDDEFEEINKQHEVDLTGSNNVDIGTDCLSISRLPAKTSDKDIADFFSDIGVIPIKIHLMSNNLGFTGQAYCEFVNSEEASRAVKKDDTMLGNIHISVCPINREEMMSILGHTLPAPSIPVAPGDSVMVKNKPNTANPATNKQMIVPPMISPNSLISQNALNQPVNDLMPINNNPMNRPFFRNFENGPNRGPPRFGPRGGAGPRPRFGGPPPDQFDESPLPGCVVYMKNVPYRAGTNEILDFFEGYHITNNVSRRYNPNNTPSDEAKVVFFDPEEAYRAVEELHHQKIWDRQIFLRQE
ncbi:hypothetical protein NQ314_017369 [Rhamnusium bicolor]|uniref:RRM domain-containing protein n=1 Tax=Rhamnusium bicolor TaxID=1586634 RepID=A0AAV8WT28_9CUCU|nr:hypothetical protein NQ314_017369 [Rhamnusium bicolor]